MSDITLHYPKAYFGQLLLEFGVAIDKKQYKNRIPYQTYRALKAAPKLSVIVFLDDGEIIIHECLSSDILYSTNLHDDGFGQFLYDTVIATKKYKENDTMKMPTMNFDFGPFTEPGVVALSPYGIAVRSSKGEYLTYNAATGATVDVTGFTFDFQKMIYKMPAATKDLRAGDMVLHRGKPMYVQSVEEDGIHCIDILNSENKVIVPVTNMFGFNFVTKVVSLMNFNAAQPSAENPFGNLMPFMMMSSVMGDDSDNDFSKMMMMSMMMGGSNPFTTMFTPQDK
jgi:hypothetical protein